MILHLIDGKTVTIQPLEPLMGYLVERIEITHDDAPRFRNHSSLEIGEWMLHLTQCKFTPPRQTCRVPPSGWYCTRQAGHEGPCAALPSSESKDSEL